jgi:hypothetical protein
MNDAGDRFAFRLCRSWLFGEPLTDEISVSPQRRTYRFVWVFWGFICYGHFFLSTRHLSLKIAFISWIPPLLDHLLADVLEHVLKIDWPSLAKLSL